MRSATSTARSTSKGERQAQRVAAWLNHQLPASARVLVSPARRAQQTAAALDRKFKTLPALAPDADVAGPAARRTLARRPRAGAGGRPPADAGPGRRLPDVGPGAGLGGAQGRRLVAACTRTRRRHSRGAARGRRTGPALGHGQHQPQRPVAGPGRGFLLQQVERARVALGPGRAVAQRGLGGRARAGSGPAGRPRRARGT